MRAFCWVDVKQRERDREREKETNIGCEETRYAICAGVLQREREKSECERRCVREKEERERRE